MKVEKAGGSGDTYAYMADTDKEDDNGRIETPDCSNRRGLSGCKSIAFHDLKIESIDVEAKQNRCESYQEMKGLSFRQQRPQQILSCLIRTSGRRCHCFTHFLPRVMYHMFG